MHRTFSEARAEYLEATTVTANPQTDPGPINPQDAPQQPEHYGKVADARVKALMEIVIKWTKTETDTEASEVLTDITRDLRDTYMPHLSEDSQNALKAL